EEAAPRLQDAPRLGERRVEPRHVAQPEGDRIGIDAARRDRQPLGIAAQPLDAGDAATVDGAVAADAQHRLVDVADDDGAALALAAAAEDGERDVAGAAGDVE